MRKNITSTAIGNKSNSLEKLKNIHSSSFTIPHFITVSNGSQIQTLPGCTKVAVRSDSIYEDGEIESGAGMFETILNVENTLESIMQAYQGVQKHALTKINDTIGVIIQEMVENPDYAGVAFSRDIRSDNPDYFTINYIDGLGNKVVDGDHKTKTKLIHKDYHPTQGFEKDLIQAIKDITKACGENMDIEFAYKDQKVYILQARRLTAVDNQQKYIQNKAKKELIEAIENKYSKKFLGDMIDINAAELLGESRSRLINTFFSYIFPENALVKGRGSLGYATTEDMTAIICDKLYIDLEQNITTFLPNTLDDKEQEILQEYFKKLLYKNPSYQNKLDTIHYPISQTQIKHILDIIDIQKTQKDIIREKFKIFFEKLEIQLNQIAGEYLLYEQALVRKYFPGAKSIADIHTYTKHTTVEQTLNNILDLAEAFTIHARGAFHFRDQDMQTGEIYHFYRYTNQLEIAAHNQKKEVTIHLSNGFDLINKQKNTFSRTKKTKKEISQDYNPTQREIFELARENIKYMMMLYITALGDHINTYSIPNIYNVDFKKLLSYETNKEQLMGKIHETTAELHEQLLLPSCIYKGNHLGMFEMLDNGGIYFPFKQKRIHGETIYIDNIHTISYEQIKQKTKEKIILIKNATPEMDSYLPYLIESKCIITKFGGPGAHIVLKIREMNQELSNKIGLVVGTGDLFETIKKHKNIQIDFTREKIQGL